MKALCQDPFSLSVCVLFFNKIGQTIDCLRSFLDAPIDIYVFNNGSHPFQREELGKFCGLHPNIQIIDSLENVGLCRGRNALIHEAKANWLFFVDNDIRIRTANWFEALTKHIAHSRNVEVFVPRVFNSHEGQYIRNVVCEIRDHRVFFESAECDYANVFPGGASIVHRDVFDRLGYYDPNIFVGFEDFELAIRGILQGQPLVVQCLHDIELVHEHLPLSTEADLETVRIRYDAKRIIDSYDLIVRKHGVYLDRNFEPWLQEQIAQQTEGTKRRIGRSFLEFFKRK